MRESREEKSSRCRALGFTCVFAALLAMTPACVKSKITVYVNPDGSGNLVVSRLFDRSVVPAIEARWSRSSSSPFSDEDFADFHDLPGAERVMAMINEKSGDAEGDEAPKKTADAFFDEKALKREAKTYGNGVKLVKARRLDVNGGRGFVAVYGFKDINDVFVVVPDLNIFQSAMYGRGGGLFVSANEGEDDDGEEGGRRGERGVEFSFQTGVVSRLKILLPVADTEDGEDAEKDDGEEDDDDAKSAVDKDAAEWLSCGMRGQYFSYGSGGTSYRSGPYSEPATTAVGLEIVFNGKIVASGASHTNAANRNRMVLLDLDTSRQDRKADQSAWAEVYSFHDFNRMVRGLAKVPCAIMETNREVVVEFR